MIKTSLLEPEKITHVPQEDQQGHPFKEGLIGAGPRVLRRVVVEYGREVERGRGQALGLLEENHFLGF